MKVTLGIVYPTEITRNRYYTERINLGGFFFRKDWALSSSTELFVSLSISLHSLDDCKGISAFLLKSTSLYKKNHSGGLERSQYKPVIHVHTATKH